jgi:hypothetical protein
MNRAYLAAALAVAACSAGTDDSEPGAIEVTGYLDASRVAIAAQGGRATAIGRDGAASPGSEIELTNATRGSASTGIASDLGTFVVDVAAADGDELTLRASGASPGDDLALTLGPSEPFPETNHLLAYVDPHDHELVTVEVWLATARLDGRAWATDPASEAVAVLEPSEGGALHSGHLAGAEGDELLLTWVADAPSTGVVVVVGLPP